MKKYMITVIILLSIICAYLQDNIISSLYYIPCNPHESSLFRHQNINKSGIEAAKELAEKNNINLSEILTVSYLTGKEEINDKVVSYSEFKKSRKMYMSLYPDNFNKLTKAIAAIYDDLEYFPVVKSKSGKYWINFEDSFGEGRNYNGKYAHEGCDIMAVNNVSGFYPVISVTDGTVENLGWLEKGGYRVGIRSNNGGYFYYAHLSSYSNIKKGDKISAGTLLGYMGDTGYGKKEGTTGKFDVHLHFGIYIKTENFEELSVNPYNILRYLENNVLYGDY
ncbi:M23 family metallopeptidase [Eubacterium sp.]|uniref:M23 family metallopeptidase n=1 Tax=Eubacterium sp. TaxID=142586 RepID=UPI0039A2E8A8